MGYRSEVGIVLTKSAASKLHERLNALDEDSLERLFVERADKHLVMETSGHELFHWEWVKWDGDFYKEVAFMESFLESLSLLEYLFIRIGQDDTDIETNGYLYDNPFGMAFQRSISYSQTA